MLEFLNAIIKKMITNDGEDVEGKKACVLLVGL